MDIEKLKKKIAERAERRKKARKLIKTMLCDLQALNACLEEMDQECLKELSGMEFFLWGLR